MNTIKAGANATLVEREKLIYPLASLVSYSEKSLNFDGHCPSMTLTLINFYGQCCCSQVCPYIPIQVAEFGGTLGLFLGFSFMTLWDGLGNLSTALNMRENLGHFCNKVRNTK